MGEMSLSHTRIANTDMSLHICMHSLIWTWLFAEEKKHSNVRNVPTIPENSKYPYEPAHLHSLIWTSLFADNFHNKSLFN